LSLPSLGAVAKERANTLQHNDCVAGLMAMQC
jgi:hypothetical protein